MIEVMNKMNYTAAAIGNHEFDFKIEGLKNKMQLSNFPFFSANIREKSSGQIPDFITPYIVKEVNGIKVGIIGGINTINGNYFSDGSPLEQNTNYSVYTIDYLYSRDDYNFSKFDSNPYYTYTNYRQPLIDWIKSLNTSVSNPLNNYLDSSRRW